MRSLQTSSLTAQKKLTSYSHATIIIALSMMPDQSASREVTAAIANTDTKDINRMVDAANSSKAKRQKLAEDKARRDAEQREKKEAAVCDLFRYEIDVY